MPSRGSSWSRPALVATIYLALAAAALVWGSLRGAPDVWHQRTAGEPQPLAGVALGVVLGLAIVAASRAAVRRLGWARALHRELRALLHPLTSGEIILLAVASSVGEEMFFRGALLPVAGIWLSSAVFALLHIGPRLRFLPWTLSSFVAGLLFAELFLWSGDLTGAVVAHFTVNFLNLRHLDRHDLAGAPLSG